MNDKLNFWKWWPTNGNLAFLAFAIFGTIFTLFFAGWDFFEPNYVDSANPQWVMWAALAFPWAVFLGKQVHTYFYWKTIK